MTSQRERAEKGPCLPGLEGSEGTRERFMPYIGQPASFLGGQNPSLYVVTTTKATAAAAAATTTSRKLLNFNK